MRYLPIEDKGNYNNFIRRVVAATAPTKLYCCTALHQKLLQLRLVLGMVLMIIRLMEKQYDFVILMTYEWGWSGGPPMAVAPINSVRAVINYAVSVIPAKKIMMGMPLYGYDWELPYEPHG